MPSATAANPEPDRERGVDQHPATAALADQAPGLPRERAERGQAAGEADPDDQFERPRGLRLVRRGAHPTCADQPSTNPRMNDPTTLTASVAQGRRVRPTRCVTVRSRAARHTAPSSGAQGHADQVQLADLLGEAAHAAGTSSTRGTTRCAVHQPSAGRADAQSRRPEDVDRGEELGPVDEQLVGVGHERRPGRERAEDPGGQEGAPRMGHMPPPDPAVRAAAP